MAKVFKDKEGVLRFQGNQIVKDLLEFPMDLNEIAICYQNRQYAFDDYWEFYQLIGCSLDAYQNRLSQDHTFEKDKE